MHHKSSFLAPIAVHMFNPPLLSSDLLTRWFKGLAVHVFGFRLASTVLEVKLSHLELLEIILEQ